MRKDFRVWVAVAVVVFAVGSLCLRTAAARRTSDDPETVIVTYHVKPGSEAELARVIARQWATGRKLELFEETPHLLVRGVDAAKQTYFVEILTWADASVPDSPPDAIKALWSEMNKLVEARGGRPGIEIVQVSVVAE